MTQTILFNLSQNVNYEVDNSKNLYYPSFWMMTSQMTSQITKYGKNYIKFNNSRTTQDISFTISQDVNYEANISKKVTRHVFDGEILDDVIDCQIWQK